MYVMAGTHLLPLTEYSQSPSPHVCVHFYSLLREITSVPCKVPSAWISMNHLAALSDRPVEKEKHFRLSKV